MTRNEWRTIFGDNLSDILEDVRLSQKQLAKDSGLAMSTISDYINKRVTPSIPAIINIAYVLDVDVEELVDFGDCIEL